MKIIPSFIFVFIFTLVAHAENSISDQEAFTRSKIAMLRDAIAAFDKQYLQYPSTDISKLFQILTGKDVNGKNPKQIHFIELTSKESNSGALLDGWNRPFIFSYDNKKDKFEVWSLGSTGSYNKSEAIKHFLYAQLIPKKVEQGAAANP